MKGRAFSPAASALACLTPSAIWAQLYRSVPGVHRVSRLRRKIVDCYNLPLDEAILDQASLECLPRLLTSKKIHASVDNIGARKDRIIDGKVVKKDDDDG